MKEKELDLEILKFLNALANKTEDGYLWREVCGLIKEIEDVKNLTIPIIGNKRKCNCIGMSDKVKCGFKCYT